MRTLLIVLGLSMMLFGCGGDAADADGNGDAADNDVTVPEPEDTAAPANPIVGIWEVVEVIEGEDIGNTGNVYTFESDGNMSISSGSFTNEGTWAMPGDTLTIKFGSVEMPILISFQDGNLVYEIVNGDQIFLMERR